MNSFNKHAKFLLATTLLALTNATTVEAKSMSFKQGALTLQFEPAKFATLMNRPGNAYNGVDSNGRPNEEHWQLDTAGTNNMVFDNGLKGIISGDAYPVRDLYFEDWFTSEEIAPLTAAQVLGISKRDGTTTIAYNLISLHNFNPLLTDDSNTLVRIHRLPLSEPWPKPTFKMYPHEAEPTKPANDNGGRNPQTTTAVFDDLDPVATFNGQIGVGGAFRVNGRYGFITVGDMALRYDPNRAEATGKAGTDGWYITAHLNTTAAAGAAGVDAFETINTKVSVTGDTLVLSGQLVFSNSVWRDSTGINGVNTAGKFRFVGKLMPTPN